MKLSLKIGLFTNLFVFCLFHCNCFAINYRDHYPDFNLSLRSYGHAQKWYALYAQQEKKTPSSDYWVLQNNIETMYEADKQCDLQSGHDRIPRIIHQIWLGSPLPEKYQEWMNSWQNWDGWEYRLWTDEDVKKLSLYNSDLYRDAKDFGEKSDILRYEILYQFGGLYVDIDFQCLNPDFFRFAHQEFLLFMGIEPLNVSKLRCGNALIASVPGHPFLEKLIHEITYSDGLGSIAKTGPVYLTKQIVKYWQLLDGAMIFPPTFFYPLSTSHVHEQFRKLFYHHETVAVHFWEGSWKKKNDKNRVPPFQNYQLINQ